MTDQDNKTEFPWDKGRKWKYFRTKFCFLLSELSPVKRHQDQGVDGDEGCHDDQVLDLKKNRHYEIFDQKINPFTVEHHSDPKGQTDVRA